MTARWLGVFVGSGPSLHRLARFTLVLILLTLVGGLEANSVAALSPAQPLELPVAAYLHSSTIDFGETVQRSIGAPAEVDTYTFSANAGDAVLVRMSVTAGELDPEIRLYGPDGAKLCEAYSSYQGTAEISNCVLPSMVYSYLPLVLNNHSSLATPAGWESQGLILQVATTGTYTILASDYGGTETGSYGLHLQRLNNPGNATALTFGQTASASIGAVAEMDAYTFTAEAGDVVLVRMGHVSGELDPEIRLYGPDGAKLCEAHSSYQGTAEIPNCALPSDGTYTILASDYEGTETGSYGLHLQRLNNPGNATALAFGQTASASIGAVAEMDAYTFTAEAGDVVLVWMGHVSGELDPEIRLYGPDGAKLCEAYSSYQGTAEISTCALPSSGSYAILAGDYGGTETGSYGLHLQRLNNPGNASALSFGETASASIGAVAEMDAYTFTAEAGDVVLVRMGHVSGESDPEIRLYGPDGAKLCEAYSSYQGMAEISNCALPSSGSYAVLVSDYGGTETGSYGLHLQRLNNSGNATALAFGQTASASIGAVAEMDAYTFTAEAGDVVLMRMSHVSGELDPEIHLYGPDGAKLCEAYSSYQGMAEISSCALPGSGPYAILASDYGGTETGSYGLHLQRLNNPGNASALSFGETTSASIGAVAQMEAYTFTAGAGDVVLVRMSHVSGELDPEIHLYGPDGAKLCEAYSSYQGTAEISNCALPSSGSYTILAGDYGGSDTGGYDLYMERLILSLWNCPGSPAPGRCRRGFALPAR